MLAVNKNAKFKISILNQNNDDVILIQNVGLMKNMSNACLKIVNLKSTFSLTNKSNRNE